MKKQFIASTLLVMKISFFQIVIAGCLAGSVYANKTSAQEIVDRKVSFSVKEEKISNVVTMLEKQTDVRFIYSPEKIQSDRKITCSVVQVKLGDFLEEILSPLHIKFRIVKGQILLYASPGHLLMVEDALQGPAQPAVNRVITGVVTDEKGEPVAGASVIIKGASIGVSADNNGFFRIKTTNDGAVLVISYTGFITREVAVSQQDHLNIVLQLNAGSLNDVVVIGYGTQRQTKITGSVASIGAKEITAVGVTGLDQALQGRIAGVQVTQNSGEPGGNVSIRIRGVGSINSSSEPLYVVDGIPLAGSINSISPNDIERIDVLKDASSAAIYGSRGSNGVVLITTKRGKAGRLIINLDAYTGFQRAAKKLDLLNGPQFAKLANENQANAGLPLNPAWNNPESQPTYDWQEAIFQTSPMQNYNISMSGGGEKSRTFFSLGYFKQGGIIVGSDFERYTARLNSDFELSKSFRVGSTLNVAYSRNNTVSTDDEYSGVLINIQQLQPTSPIYANQAGVINDHFYGWEGYNFISGDAPVNFYPSGLNNEVHYYKKRYLDAPASSFEVMGSAFAELDLVKGLKFRSMINLTFGNDFNQAIRRKAPDELDNVGQYRASASYGENWSKFLQWNWINTMSYAQQFGSHNLSAVAGIDALNNNQRGIGANGVDNLPGQNSIEATDNIAGRRVDGSPSDFSLLSYFGRLTYDYRGKYLLSANFRRDGSSKFGPNNKYGNFPSASIGWRISQEPFMEKIAAIDELKLRASFGTVGNQGIPNFKYLSTFSNDGGTYQYVLGSNQLPFPATYRNNIGDPNIHWEKSVQTNIGIDASFLKGRFTVTAEYYIKKISDLLGEFPIPAYGGVFGNSQLLNGFSMTNRGFELTVGYKETFGKVNFSVNGNFSTLRNKVTKLTANDNGYISTPIFEVNDDNAQTRSQVGEPIANFWGYVTDGIFQNQAEIDKSGMEGVSPGDRRFVDLNGDGVFNSDDKRVLGNGLPKKLFALNLRAEYHHFDISLFLNGQADVQIANMNNFFLYGMRYYNATGLTNASTALLNAWHGEGTSNEIPRNAYDSPDSNRFFSTFYIENGAFLRIRNLQLGYTLPVRWSGKIAASNARIYLSAQNLHTFTKYKGYDPEIGSFNQNPLATGTDQGRYPVARTFLAGINFQF